jgi:hypothetical protein
MDSHSPPKSTDLSTECPQAPTPTVALAAAASTRRRGATGHRLRTIKEGRRRGRGHRAVTSNQRRQGRSKVERSLGFLLPISRHMALKGQERARPFRHSSGHRQYCAPSRRHHKGPGLEDRRSDRLQLGPVDVVGRLDVTKAAPADLGYRV